MNTKPTSLEVKVGKANSLKSAAERAAEIRASFDGGNLDEGTDDFFVEQDKIPPGWTYEWKMFTVFNKEDPSYQVTLRRAGWEPVPAERHPEMMPVGFTEKTIVRKGMMLMERPTEITDEVRRIERKNAIEPLRIREAKLKGDNKIAFDRDNDGESLVKIKKSYEPMPIPKDA